MQVIENRLQTPTTYLSIILNPTTNLGVQQICQILYPTLSFVMESKFTKFSRDSSFGLSAQFTIKLKEASSLFQSEPYRLKAETQEIKLHGIPFEVSAILLTVHYLVFLGMRS